MATVTRLMFAARRNAGIWRCMFGMGVATLACIVFWNQIQTLDFSLLRRSFVEISATQWGLSAIAAVCSFLAIGQYDLIWHRILATGIPARRARATGMMAIAIGQTIGLSSVVSAFVRWRRLPGVDAQKVAGISAAVALSFMLCWLIIAIPAIWSLAETRFFLPPPPMTLLAILVLLAFSLVRLASQNNVSLVSGFQLLFFTAADILFAGTALFLLLPADQDSTFALVLAGYTLALGLGLVSNAPGGLGSFELVLLAILSPVFQEPTLAAILAFRIIYYLIPFVIAMLCMVRPNSPLTSRPLLPVSTSVMDGFLHDQAPPHWGLARLSGKILRGRNTHFYLASTLGCAVSLGDPLRIRRDVNGTKQLEYHAETTGKSVAVYKSSPRFATEARKAGWICMPIAKRAIIKPQNWDIGGRRKQQLRRKLRRADLAGVGIRVARHDLPFDQMDEVAQEWAAQHQGELRTSMGHYNRSYVAKQLVILIYHKVDLVGFVTFNTSRQGWALDLMRYEPAIPDGAVHLAIATAIEQAKSAGVTNLCLDAVPLHDGPFSLLHKGKQGLDQFKQSFSPEWQRLYHCAPSYWSFGLTLAVLAWNIQNPLERIIISLSNRYEESS